MDSDVLIVRVRSMEEEGRRRVKVRLVDHVFKPVDT